MFIAKVKYRTHWHSVGHHNHIQYRWLLWHSCRRIVRHKLLGWFWRYRWSTASRRHLSDGFHRVECLWVLQILVEIFETVIPINADSMENIHIIYSKPLLNRLKKWCVYFCTVYFVHLPEIAWLELYNRKQCDGAAWQHFWLYEPADVPNHSIQPCTLAQLSNWPV